MHHTVQLLLQNETGLLIYKVSLFFQIIKQHSILMTNSIPLRHDYMSHLPFFPAEESKGCEIGEIRHPRGGYIHAKGQKIFTDLESSGHGKKDVGTLVSYRQDEGKTFPCQ